MAKENYQWTEYFPKFFNKIYNKTSETLYKEYNENILEKLKNANYLPYNYHFNKIDPLSFFTRMINLKKIWSAMKLYDDTIEFQTIQQCGIPFININKLEWWKEAYNNQKNKNKISKIFNNLEEFARQIYKDEIERNLFNIICEYSNNGLIKTSLLLFYIRPEKYYPLDKKMQNYASFSINYKEEYYKEFCRLQKFLHEKFQNDNRKIYEISDAAHKNFLKEKKKYPEKFLKTEGIIAIAMYKDNGKSYNINEVKNLKFCKLYLKHRAQINSALQKDYFQNHNSYYSLTMKGQSFAKNFLSNQQRKNQNIDEETMNYTIYKNNKYSKQEKNELTNQYIKQYLNKMNIKCNEKEKSFFEIKISDNIYTLKSRTYNGHYVLVEKSEISDLSPNIMIALVEWINGKPSNLYFIPMSEWKNPDLTILKDRNYEGLKSKPEWGIDINQTNKHELNQFLANKIIESINEKEDKKIIEEIDNCEADINKETEKQALVKIRMGHSKLRNRILNHKTKCEICGIKNNKLLIISHIKPWSKSEDHEKLDESNILLLCSMHDALFDKGLISFDDNGKILISSELDENEQALVNVNEDSYIKITSDRQIEFLKYHRENIFIK